MPNLFDSFSLMNHFVVQDSTTRTLQRVSQAIGTPLSSQLFERLLLNDDGIREVTKNFKEGVDFQRERISSLLGKIQQLQQRLQTAYSSMLDRIMATNSANVGTSHKLTDSWANR